MSLLEDILAKENPLPPLATDALTDVEKKVEAEQGILGELKLDVKEPVRLLPAILEGVGASVGLAGGPVGVATGAMLGRAGGEAIESLITGRPFITERNAFEILSSPLAAIGLDVMTGAVRRLLGKPIVKATSKEIVSTILPTEARALSSATPQALNTADDAIRKAKISALQQRWVAYWGKPGQVLDADGLAIKRAYEQEIERTTIAKPKIPQDIVDQVYNMKRMALLRPNNANSALVREFQKVGLAPTLNNPQWILRRSGDPYLEKIADAALFNSELQSNIRSVFKERAGALLEKHKITADDYGTFLMLDRNPDLLTPKIQPAAAGMVRFYHGGTPGTGARWVSPDYDYALGYARKSQSAVQYIDVPESSPLLQKAFDDTGASVKAPYVSFNAPAALMANAKILTATMVPPSLSKEGRLQFTRVAAFTKEYQTEVNDTLFALAKEFNPDPKELAVFRPNFIFSSSTGVRELERLTDDIARYDKLLASTTHGTPEFATLLQQSNALKRKQYIARASAQKAEGALRAAEDLFTKYGRLPNKKFFGAMLPKESNLVFGSDPLTNAAEYIDSLARKLTLDQSLPIMNDALKNVTDPRARKFASNYILDQAGYRRAQSLMNMADYATDAIKTFGGSHTVTPQQVNRLYDEFNEIHFAFNLGLLNFRFPLINLSQNFLTLRPLVGRDAFAHGLAQASAFMVGKNPELLQRAIKSQAITKDMAALYFGELPTTNVGALGKAIHAGTFLARKTEEMNRLVGYAAGEYVAKAEGLAGEHAARRAANITKMAHFGFSTAERPTITNTPIGSMAFRFKSFTTNYINYLQKLKADGNYKAIGESLATAMGLAGTAGIPFYDSVRGVAASTFGIFLPEVNPIDQLTGLDIGAAMDPFFRAPRDVADLAGPIFGPALKTGIAAAELDIPQAIKESSRILGLPGRFATGGALAETISGGQVRSPASGKLLAVHTPGQTARALMGLGPTGRSARSETFRELVFAIQSGDPLARQRVVEKAMKERIVGLPTLIAAAKSAVITGAKTSTLEKILGGYF